MNKGLSPEDREIFERLSAAVDMSVKLPTDSTHLPSAASQEVGSIPDNSGAVPIANESDNTQSANTNEDPPTELQTPPRMADKSGENVTVAKKNHPVLPVVVIGGIAAFILVGGADKIKEAPRSISAAIGQLEGVLPGKDESKDVKAPEIPYKTKVERAVAALPTDFAKKEVATLAGSGTYGASATKTYSYTLRRQKKSKAKRIVHEQHSVTSTRTGRAALIAKAGALTRFTVDYDKRRADSDSKGYSLVAVLDGDKFAIKPGKMQTDKNRPQRFYRDEWMSKEIIAAYNPNASRFPNRNAVTPIDDAADTMFTNKCADTDPTSADTTTLVERSIQAVMKKETDAKRDGFVKKIRAEKPEQAAILASLPLKVRVAGNEDISLDKQLVPGMNDWQGWLGRKASNIDVLSHLDGDCRILN